MILQEKNWKRLNPNWPQIPDHSYRILITGGPGSGKTNALLNVIDNQKKKLNLTI